MYILKFLHFAKPNRPKRISDNTYLALSPDEANHYKHENDETEYAPAVDDEDDNGASYTALESVPGLSFDSSTDCTTPVTDDTPTFSGFGGGDFGGGGSSASWSDDSSSQSSSSDSGNSSYDSGSSSYDSGSSSSDSGPSSSDW